MLPSRLSTQHALASELVRDDERWWKTAGMVASNEWLETSNRGLEIADLGWNRLSFNNFIIPDDMADMRPVQDNSLRCSTCDGIGFFQYEEAGKNLAPIPVTDYMTYWTPLPVRFVHRDSSTAKP
jgi:hypothetical protein